MPVLGSGTGAFPRRWITRPTLSTKQPTFCSEAVGEACQKPSRHGKPWKSIQFELFFLCRCTGLVNSQLGTLVSVAPCPASPKWCKPVDPPSGAFGHRVGNQLLPSPRCYPEVTPPLTLCTSTRRRFPMCREMAACDQPRRSISRCARSGRPQFELCHKQHCFAGHNFSLSDATTHAAAARICRPVTVSACDTDILICSPVDRCPHWSVVRMCRHSLVIVCRALSGVPV